MDQFNATSDILNKFYIHWWYEYIQQGHFTEIETKQWLQRREFDKENTIEESLELLRAVGFKHVECIYSFMKFGVLFAIK
jgi:hypothetical protein